MQIWVSGTFRSGNSNALLGWALYCGCQKIKSVFRVLGIYKFEVSDDARWAKCQNLTSRWYLCCLKGGSYLGAINWTVTQVITVLRERNSTMSSFNLGNVHKWRPTFFWPFLTYVFTMSEDFYPITSNILGLFWTCFGPPLPTLSRTSFMDVPLY